MCCGHLLSIASFYGFLETAGLEMALSMPAFNGASAGSGLAGRNRPVITDNLNEGCRFSYVTNYALGDLRRRDVLAANCYSHRYILKRDRVSDL